MSRPFTSSYAFLVRCLLWIKRGPYGRPDPRSRSSGCLTAILSCLLPYPEWRLGPSSIFQRVDLCGVESKRAVNLRLNHHLGSGRSCSRSHWRQGRQLPRQPLRRCQISSAVYGSRQSRDPFLSCLRYTISIYRHSANFPKLEESALPSVIAVSM